MRVGHTAYLPVNCWYCSGGKCAGRPPRTEVHTYLVWCYARLELTYLCYQRPDEPSHAYYYLPTYLVDWSLRNQQPQSTRIESTRVPSSFIHIHTSYTTQNAIHHRNIHTSTTHRNIPNPLLRHRSKLHAETDRMSPCTITSLEALWRSRTAISRHQGESAC